MIVSATDEGHEGIWTTFGRPTPISVAIYEAGGASDEENCAMLSPGFGSLQDIACTRQDVNQFTACEHGGVDYLATCMSCAVQGYANLSLIHIDDSFHTCRVSSGITTSYSIIDDVTGDEAVTSCPSGMRLAEISNNDEFLFLSNYLTSVFGFMQL